MSTTLSSRSAVKTTHRQQHPGFAVGRPPLDRRLLAGIALLVAAALVCVPAMLSPNLAADFAAALARLWGRVSTLTWPAVLCLVVVSALHYVAAAVAARAAAGVPLPFGELVGTQFAASAANRLTPAGLGGATVTGRYFRRRGRLQPAQAAAAVSSLMVLGGLADILAFAALIGLGTAVGLSGASGEVPLLVHRMVGLIPVPAGWWLWVAAGAAPIVIAAAWLSRRRAGTATRRAANAVRAYRASLGDLVRRPSRLATLLTTSAATTVLLAAGFAAVATIGPNGLPASSFCALMVGYMLAAAAGNALPTPGGIGTADAAFIGVLVAAHMPAATALATVLVFRLVTFWAPAVIGLGLLQPLRRRGAF